jgi:hypothetical protein
MYYDYLPFSFLLLMNIYQQKGDPFGACRADKGATVREVVVQNWGQMEGVANNWVQMEEVVKNLDKMVEVVNN